MLLRVAFAKNYQSPSQPALAKAMRIDKASSTDGKISSLAYSENQLRLANNKLDDVSVKKLTRKILP